MKKKKNKKKKMPRPGPEASQPPSLVDMGGNVGHDMQRFDNAHPDAAGRCYLQDRPEVVRLSRVPDPVRKMGYDFFTAQPIRGQVVQPPFPPPPFPNGPTLSPGRIWLTSTSKRTAWFLVEPFSSKLYSKGFPSLPTPLLVELESGFPHNWGQITV